MKALPTQQRALLKRTALINAAISEFSSVGFDVATAKTIALAANVATGTFYQYFDNKNDILRVIAKYRFESVEQQIKTLGLAEADGHQQQYEKVAARFFETLNFVYEFHASAPHLHQVLEQRRLQDLKLDKIMSDGEVVLCERILDFVRTFNFSEPEIIADNLFSMGEGLVHRLVFNQQSKDYEKALETGAHMLARFFTTRI